MLGCFQRLEDKQTILSSLVKYVIVYAVYGLYDTYRKGE